MPTKYLIIGYFAWHSTSNNRISSSKAHFRIETSMLKGFSVHPHIISTPNTEAVMVDAENTGLITITRGMGGRSLLCSSAQSLQLTANGSRKVCACHLALLSRTDAPQFNYSALEFCFPDQHRQRDTRVFAVLQLVQQLRLSLV